MSDELESRLLSSLQDVGPLSSSSDFATSQAVDHGRVVGLIKSLQSDGLVTAEVLVELSPDPSPCMKGTIALSHGIDFHA